ncbi:MAG: YggS family pyridoxal phosphate-dependent enzyme [Pseudomonadales bacterium]|nr:YggS family pyridoxal phosphate-dependent enzyme [Pseudomonadales bacterium]
MSTLSERLNRIRVDMTESALKANRLKGDITLLAVSKKRTAAELKALVELGVLDFGESYWQEAQAKLALLTDAPITWHFIGPIQSNKTKPIAEHFDWVHSIASLKVAMRLDNQRPEAQAPINGLVQINIDNEESKTGLSPDELPLFLEQTEGLGQLKIRGLMCLPLKTDDLAKQRESFEKLRELRDGLKSAHPNLTLLSMGMSKDFKTAIQEGSDIVRIGTALFGPRPQ